MGGMAHEDTIKDCNVPLRLLHIIIDLTAAKTDERPQARNKIKHTFTAKYINHLIKKLRLGNILRDPVLEDKLPVCLKDKGQVTVVYKYQHTVRGRPFIYKDKHDADINKIDCACQDSGFKDTDHDHIVTANLHILRGLYRKGPNNREKSLNWMKAFDSLKKDTISFIAEWSSKICKPKEYLCEWKSWSKERKVLEEEKQMQTSEKSVEIPRLKELTRLRQQFVLVPIDKAANNIGFICKKYFLEALHQETISNTYVPY